MVILQGMRKLQYLAQANLFGSVFGLLITIPLYYIFSTDGIVPAIVITSSITLTCSWFFAKKIKVDTVEVSRKEAINTGKNMLIMGLMISLSGLISHGASYVVRIFISHSGGVEQVGLYTAGFAIINTYVAMIFNAMGTDYYPRLSAVANDNALCRKTISQQAEIALLILTPILMVFLVFIQFMIILLYSDKFISIDTMIHWAALGVFFKAVSWAISYLLLAKGDSKLFFWNELVGSTYVIGLNILGYYLWGLNGLGISYLVGFLIYLTQVFILSVIKYQFAFDQAFYKIFIIQFILILSCFIMISFIDKPLSYGFGVIFILISSFYTYKELDHRIDIKSALLKIKSKFNKQ